MGLRRSGGSGRSLGRLWLGGGFEGSSASWFVALAFVADGWTMDNGQRARGERTGEEAGTTNIQTLNVMLDAQV